MGSNVKCQASSKQPMSAAQQPEWGDRHQVAQVRNVLAATGSLVDTEQVLALRGALATAARGEALVLQAGDCAEHPDECRASPMEAKAALVHRLADLLGAESGLPVIRVGRIAGQFAKPRSRPLEETPGSGRLPVYRGHMVNLPAPDAHSRRPDPLRLLMCFMTAREAMEHLGWRADADWQAREAEDLLWTSHEALLMDYEQPQLRPTGDDRLLLGSTHWPWIGERTRQLDGAHVDLLSRVVNPVACKVGPGMTPDELVELCARLDPHRDPGRLALIVRMGPDLVTARLPALARAVQDAGHPVLWLCDPLHANTVKRPDGTKTRHVATAVDEVRRFSECLNGVGAQGRGLHLETSPYAVDECVGGPAGAVPAAMGAASLCDPRLGPAQAAEVVAAWSAVGGPRGASVLTRRGLS
ncbi:3-deoxy-7-phosphoheptulonate synthase [Streptomyces sp. rh34]|uniref:3-deoxy-7-phosphoheptulonate synthase n=1 Tax=Streptomyces sp. rh34 TaxID=2034272 RepID=UPI0027B9DB53|nr:3-deoxy-7-phosphoheptulonate synthase [Streptomyces sp. rh34]